MCVPAFRRGCQLAPRLVLVCVLILGCFAVTQAQTFSVLHNFTGGGDGSQPWVGVTMDQAGNLYGTTSVGGLQGGCGGMGCGVVFKLAHRGSGWSLTPLYTFTGGGDGALPLARVIFGPNGTLYGSTILGGNDSFPNGVGVIFNLYPPARVPARVLSPWVEDVLYTFSGVSDGNNPTGDLVFDSAGNIYGTTQSGGYECEDTVYCGTVFELAHNGNNWNESLLFAFTNGEVAVPLAGAIFDATGNLYGTTWNGNGAVYELVHSGSSWTESTLYYFGGPGDGLSPRGGVVFDAGGDLYGTTQYGGANGVGSVFELMHSGGRWTESVPYSLTNGGSPYASLVMDSAGNLYGTSCEGGVNNSGSVFKLTHSGGGWTEADLYDFTGGNDGSCPVGNVIVDPAGNVYGTTLSGGTSQNGVVFEIAQ